MGLKAVAGGGGSSAGTQTPAQIAAMSNNVALLTPKWRIAAGRVNAKTGDATIVCVGNSITSGSFSGGAASTKRTLSYPTFLAQKLNSIGLPAESENFLGDGFGGNLATADARLSIGTSFADHTNFYSIGGCPFQATTNTSPLTWTPSTPVNAFDIWYIQTVAASSFSWAIDGGSATTIVTTGAGQLLQKVTVNAAGPVGMHTLSLLQVSGTPQIQGIDAYNNTIKQVHVINAGWPTSTGFNQSDQNQAYSPANAVASSSLGVDLYIYEPTWINDLNGGNTPAQFLTFHQTAITAMKASGADVVLLIANPISIAVQTLAAQTAYIQNIFTLAANNTLLVVDIFDRFVSYEFSQPLGYFSSNNTHPLGAGYSDMAQGIVDLIGKEGPAGITNTTVQTTVTGSTSGTATFNQLNSASGLKKVTVHVSVLLGTASYTFPVPFVNTPVLIFNNTGITPTVSTTSVTLVGATSSGYITLEEQQ